MTVWDAISAPVHIGVLTARLSHCLVAVAEVPKFILIGRVRGCRATRLMHLMLTILWVRLRIFIDTEVTFHTDSCYSESNIDPGGTYLPVFYQVIRG